MARPTGRTPVPAGRSRGSRWRALLLALVAMLFLSYLSYQSVLVWLGRHLVRIDEPENGDVIVAVGDSAGRSEEEAVGLYRRGFARRVLMTGSTIGWQHTMPQLMADHALNLGVPEGAIIVQPPTDSPYEAAKLLKVLAKSRGWHALIAVTAPMQTRRMRRIYGHFFPGPFYRVSVVPYPEPRYGADSWWLSQAGRDAVILEWGRLVWYKLRYRV